MREIVLDTETTGLDPQAGHRIVEIACIELVHHIPTGREFHRFVDPGRDMPEDALEVHGLTAQFLAAHPPFAAIVDELFEFIGADPLVIHNAEFDLAFLNAELARLDRPSITPVHIDTLTMARQRYPGSAGEPRRAVPAIRRSTRRSGSIMARRSTARCLPPSISS